MKISKLAFLLSIGCECFAKPKSASATALGVDAVSNPMQIVLLLTALTFLPAIVMCLTPFLRITVVLHFLRQALGTQTVPSNQVLIGLALFLTLLVMQPVAAEIYTKAWAPLESGELTLSGAVEEGAKPLRTYLLKFIREPEVKLFLDISKTPAPARPADLDMKIVAPAYVLSELKASFQIGAMLFLPFLVVDLMVASVTLTVGMVQLPPVTLSAPFKLLLFVLVDGWNLVVGSLLKSLY
jgi:flagellar biosynthetic protein FliP